MQRCKEAKKAKQVAHSKQGKPNIAHIKHTNITEMYLTSGHTQTIHKRDGCNHISNWPQKLMSTSTQRAQSIAKPRSRQANMDIKHKSKET